MAEAQQDSGVVTVDVVTSARIPLVAVDLEIAETRAAQLEILTLTVAERKAAENAAGVRQQIGMTSGGF